MRGKAWLPRAAAWSWEILLVFGWRRFAGRVFTAHARMELLHRVKSWPTVKMDCVESVKPAAFPHNEN
jgi:hypothetical protein